MNRYLKAQIIIDAIILLLGVSLNLLPHATSINATRVFYILMSIYSILELIEFAFNRKIGESFWLFAASSVCAFSGFFLEAYQQNIVLSITLIVWLLTITIIKIMNLKNIYKDYNRLFIIKLAGLSIILTIGVLATINIYFRISVAVYMLSLIYMVYGFFEGLSDICDFFSRNEKVLKE